MKKTYLYSFVVSLALVGVLMGACSYCNEYVGLSDDHPIEELAEEVIKARYGYDIDLTPTTREK